MNKNIRNKKINFMKQKKLPTLENVSKYSSSSLKFGKQLLTAFSEIKKFVASIVSM